MRPFTSTISIDEARRRLAAGVRPIARRERVTLADAAGRVAAADVTSPMAVPPFARSVMDGYAVVAGDTETASHTSPIGLRIVERVYTGETPRRSVAQGTCAEIATGAPLPDGADAVVMVEETRRGAGADDIEILAAAAPGQNIGRRGADIAPGDLVVRHGDVLNPSRIGALAAVGCAQVDVYALPRVAVLSTGNEIVDPGVALAGAQIYDVNRFTLSSVVAAHGGIPQGHRAAEDTLDGLVHALDDCRDADVIVFSGGSSVGDRDLIVDLVAARGEMIFHGIAVRPGKPTAFAMVRSGTASTAGGPQAAVPFFGMPGNPTSCLSNAYILLVPFLRATARLPIFAPRTVTLPLGRRIVSAVGRHQFYTVRMENGSALPAFKGSGEITSLSRADGYIEIPADQSSLEEGSLVEVVLF